MKNYIYIIVILLAIASCVKNSKTKDDKVENITFMGVTLRDNANSVITSLKNDTTQELTLVRRNYSVLTSDYYYNPLDTVLGVLKVTLIDEESNKTRGKCEIYKHDDRISKIVFTANGNQLSQDRFSSILAMYEHKYGTFTHDYSVNGIDKPYTMDLSNNQRISISFYEPERNDLYRSYPRDWINDTESEYEHRIDYYHDTFTSLSIVYEDLIVRKLHESELQKARKAKKEKEKKRKEKIQEERKKQTI